MSSISERLKALGVSLGTENVRQAVRGRAVPIHEVVAGETRDTPFGEAFVIDQFFPTEHVHGTSTLRFPPTLDKVAAWARDARLAAVEPGGFLFLDTETTGLAGGSGTYAFLVGVGRFEEGGFRQMQFFLRDPIEEPAMLSALESFAAPADALVTFNGKAFDIPLMTARYLTNAAPPPFGGLPHLDLLHLARRLWREMLPSRTLGDLETQVLGILRTGEDIPGFMIPQLYIEYLRSGDARPLAGVFYHNSMDVLSMAALLEHMARLLAAPLEAVSIHHTELYAIGRLFADLGFADEAIQIFENTMSYSLDADTQFRLVENLACLHRRRGDYSAALELWQGAASDGHVYAHVEIAKYYEHRAGEVGEALRYTRTALEIISATDISRFERLHWQPLLEHRLSRLERKLARNGTGGESELED
jgi:hypothetical protein